MQSFHAYPSAPQLVESGSRCVPLKCDIVEWDTTGCFVPFDPAHPTTTGCFLASVPCVVEFHVNVLFDTPNNYSEIGLWLFKSLPTQPYYSDGEIAGYDVPCYQPPNYNNGAGAAYNISAQVTRKVKMATGDRIWAVPGINGTRPNGSTQGLTGASSGGLNNVNYFEGKVLEIL